MKDQDIDMEPTIPPASDGLALLLDGHEIPPVLKFH